MDELMDLRVGDEVFEEPPRVEGLTLRDRDGDLVTWVDARESWVRGDYAVSWDEVFQYTPIRVVQVDPTVNWVDVEASLVEEGDTIEVTYGRDDHAPAVIRGTVTQRGLRTVWLRDTLEVPLDGTTIRRQRRRAEPGPGAVWAAKGQRYYNTGARGEGGAYLWTTPRDPHGSYDWTSIRTYGPGRLLLAAPGEGGA